MAMAASRSLSKDCFWLLAHVERFLVGPSCAHQVDAAPSVKGAEHDRHLGRIDGGAYPVPKYAGASLSARRRHTGDWRPGLPPRGLTSERSKVTSRARSSLPCTRKSLSWARRSPPRARSRFRPSGTASETPEVSPSRPEVSSGRPGVNSGRSEALDDRASAGRWFERASIRAPTGGLARPPSHRPGRRPARSSGWPPPQRG